MKKIIPLLLIILMGYIHAVIAHPNCVKASTIKEKTVYLTFDDGPSKNTEEILEILKENDVNATFFVIGENVLTHKSTTKKIVSQGNAIGIHSHTHNYKQIYQNPQTLLEDIDDCISAVKSVLPDYKITLYRFPGGSFNLSDELKAVPEKRNLTYFDWNASCRDCELKGYTPDDLLEACISTGTNKNKIILLMHDAPAKHRSVLALQKIINYYKNNGYVFKTLTVAVK